MRKVSGIALACIVMVGLACASKRVLVPARVDLHPYGRIGLVTFTVENAKGNLHQFATERFAENVLSAQPGIEILPIFKYLQREGNVPQPDMWRTFNMGIGMVLAVAPGNVATVESHLAGMGERHTRIGLVEEGPRGVVYRD